MLYLPLCVPRLFLLVVPFVPALHGSDSFRGSVCTGKLINNRETDDDPEGSANQTGFLGMESCTLVHSFE